MTDAPESEIVNQVEQSTLVRNYVPLRNNQKTHHLNLDLQSQISGKSTQSAGTVYSLTQQHDRRAKREHLKKLKQSPGVDVTEPIIEEN